MPAGSSDKQIHLDDIRRFLQVYKRANRGGLPPEERQSFYDLFVGLGKHTTVVGQLTRVVEYFIDDRFKACERGPGFELLFRAKTVGGGLEPTPAADELYRRLEILNDAYARSRDAVDERLREEIGGSGQRTVRIGIPHIVARYFLSYVFSDWDRRFGEFVKLDVELGNSSQLVERLSVGLLDVVFGYGPQDAEIQDEKLPVKFRSIGYYLDMVLLFPKEGETPSRERKSGERQDGFYHPSDDCEGIRLADDYNFRIPLLIVPSYNQPVRLEQIVKKWERSIKVRRLNSYDEALSLVRMGLGVAPALETFAQRSGVSSYRLMPEEEYRRWLGGYFSTRFDISAETCCVMEFISKYLNTLQGKGKLWRKGPLPDVSDKGIAALYRKFGETHNFQQSKSAKHDT